jgi:hypothetical protein
MSRVCPVCCEPLDGHRCDAIYCSPACRREAGRIRAVLAGKADGPYSTRSGSQPNGGRGVQNREWRREGE